MIREGFLDSEKVAALSWRTECFFHRLLLVADDYGLFDARPTVLRTRLFPLHLDKISNQDIQDCLHETEEAGLVRAYCVGGKDYVQIINFGQRRQSKPKFPLPDGDSPCNTVSHGSSRESTVNNGESRKSTAYTETETKTDTYTKSETETNNTPLPPPCTVEEVEAHLRAAAFAGRVRLAPDQIPDCATAYISKRDLTDWKRGEIPITAAKWKSDSINFAVSYSANHPAQPGTDKDPYSNLEEL